MAKTKDIRIGLEFDGTTVRAAALDTKTGRITNVGVFTNDDTLTQALNAWARSDLNHGTPLAAWTGPYAHFTTTEIPDLPDDAVLAAIQATADDQFVHGGDGIFAAGVIGTINEATRQRHVTVSGLERQAITTELWKALDSHDVPVTLPGLLIHQDGVYLGIHGSNTELTVVVGGVGVFSRSLQVGGVDHLVELAKEGQRERLNNVAFEYISDLQSELTSTISYAASKHDFFPSRVWVYGPGSAVPGFVKKLGAESGYEVLVPEPLVDTSGIDKTQVGSHFMAILAAAVDLDTNPFITIDNPYRKEKHAKRVEQAKKSRRLVVMVASIVGVALALGAAVLPAMKARSDAEGRQQDLLASLAAVAEADEAIQHKQAGLVAWAGVTLQETDWTAFISDLNSVTPAGMSFNTLALTRDEAGRLNVTIQAQVFGDAGFPGVAAWLASLETIGATNVVPSNVTQSDGTTTLSVVFSISEPTSYITARPAPGDIPDLPVEGVQTGTETVEEN